MAFNFFLNREILVTIIIFFLFDCVICSRNTTSQTIKVAGWDVKESKDNIIFTIFILFVSLGKLCYHKFKFLSAYFPESFLLIVFGIIAGYIIRYPLKEEEHFIKLTPVLFFLVLLPPIVLDSVYHMYNRTFGEILGIVIIFAVFGTIFSFLIIGASLYGLEQANVFKLSDSLTDNLMAILLFSSLIVAVDPVAVLAIFKDIGVDKELYYMIFGESLLNDAVTIVLYEIIKEFMILGTENVTPVNIILGLVSFFTVSVGGLLIGIIIGILSSIVTRFQSENEIHSIILMSSAYLAYILAYSIKWSGIMSIIGCGIVQAAYAFKNISKHTQINLRSFIELMAGVSEAVIFVFLGLEVFIVKKLVWNAGFQISSFILCIIARLIVTFTLRMIINYVKVDQRKITWTEMFIVTYGGLRGAVAFCLVILIIPDEIWVNNVSEGEKIYNLFVTTTLIIIILTVSVMGTTMKPIAKFLSVKSEKQKVLSLYNELNTTLIDNLMSGLEVVTGYKGRNRFRTIIANFDNKYIRPWLVNDPCNNTTLKILKRLEQVSLILHYASLEGNYAEEKLVHIPKSLWPKPKEQMIPEESIEEDVIRSMRKVSKLVKFASTNTYNRNKIEFNDMLQSNFNNRLKEVVRRKSTVCRGNRNVQLPSVVANLIPMQNKWKFILEDFDDNKQEEKIIVTSVPWKTNKGFINDEEIQMTENFSSKI